MFHRLVLPSGIINDLHQKYVGMFIFPHNANSIYHTLAVTAKLRKFCGNWKKRCPMEIGDKSIREMGGKVQLRTRKEGI